MKRIYIVFFCMLLAVNVALADNKIDNGTWNDDKGIYVNTRYNLQWDLSGMKWRIAEDYRLPENMIFCAATQDDFICVSLCAFPSEEELDDDFWEYSDEFIDGYSEILKGYQVFPGIETNSLVHEKCYFLFKQAIRFACLQQISDARLGTASMTVLNGGYVFEKNNTLFVATIMLPYEYVAIYGDEIVEIFFRGLSYIDATKEIEQKQN